MTDYSLGTRKRGDSLTFTVDLTVTIDDVDETDLSDWTPTCQFRATPDAPTGHDAELLDVTGTVLTFGLSDAVTAAMDADDGIYYGDVQVVNPAADDGYGVITWPGGNGYLKLTLYGDVTRSA